MWSTDILVEPKKKQQIYLTAEDLFQRYGIKRVTIEEICEKASVSKMTFYKYFPNKFELVKFMMNNWYEQSVKMINEIRIMEVPFMEKIKMMLRIKETSTSNFSKEFLADYMDPESELQFFIAEFYNKILDSFIEFIKESQKKGEVRPEMHPEFFLAVVNKMIELAKDPNILNLYPSVTEFSMEVNNFLCCGILPLDKLESKSV